MPSTLTYPGVYIEEISSGVHTISGVATSIAAFVGYTKSGLDNRAKRIFSFSDYERSFGGLASDSELSYAVQQFFQNGGSDAYVVRVPKSGSTIASMKLRDKASGGADVLQIFALSKGTLGNLLVIDIDYDGILPTDTTGFNLTISNASTGATETFGPVTMDNKKANYIEAVVNDEDNGSRIVSVKVLGSNRPAQSGTVGGDLALDSTGKPTGIINAKNLAIKISSDLPIVPAISGVSVQFLAKDEPIPTSVLGVCRLLERKINTAIQAIIPEAKVSCIPATTATGIAVRVIASIPNASDAVLTFAKGVVDVNTDDADSVLKLSTATNNIAHYWFNTSRGLPMFAEGARSTAVDGTALPTATDLVAGLSALDKVDLFNILCIPDATRAKVSDPTKSDLTFPSDQNSIFAAALTYCKSRRAFLIIDPPPEVSDVDKATDWISSQLTVHDPNGNAAAYFPRIKLPDPLNNLQLRTFAPCGVVAKLYARTDSARGVWKAPAGVDANLDGVQGMVYKLTDSENGALNPLGLNCFRIFPTYGPVAWGARTIAGADAAASEWKYIPVRRLALFLEESLYRGTKWVVFEPNDEPLWSQIRLNLGAFMHTLFLQGAFQGNTPQKAYFVKCNSETTTQDDINRGVVNIIVGFAPLKPAEFVVIKIQQMAGQIQT